MDTPSKALTHRGSSCRGAVLALILCCGGWLVPASLRAALPNPPAPIVEVLYEAPNGQLLPGLPPEVLIGEHFHFKLRVLPMPGYTGYGPFVELYLQYAGADCNSGSLGCDGLSFVNANAEFTTTILPLTPCQPGMPFVFPDSNPPCVAPFACPLTTSSFPSCFFGATPSATPTPMCASGEPVAGFQKVVLPLPFGSFVPNQPAVLIDVTANVDKFANAGFPLTVKARGGYQYGNSASGGPPSIDGNCMTPWTTNPSVLILHKEFLGPEDETATGPNFPVTYKISVDVANGQTLTGLVVNDCLPSNLVFTGFVVSSFVPPPSSFSPPPGCLTVFYSSVTGTAVHPNLSFNFQAYVPDLDTASGQPVLGASCKTVIDNPVTATGQWTPLDLREGPSAVTARADKKITAKCIALQKSANVFHPLRAPAPVPGDTVRYTLRFQISDFDTFDGIVLDDYLANGLTLVPGSAFLTLSDAFPVSPVSGSITPMQPSGPAVYTCNDGTQMLQPTHLQFDVSSALMSFDPLGRHGLGILTGGQAAGLPFGGPATGTLTFRAKIDDLYNPHIVPAPYNVKKDDTLPNCPVISGDLLQNTNAPALPPPGVIGTGDDDSIAKVTIATGILRKSIVAVNFLSVPPSPPPLISPGDDVTFRLTLPLPSTDAASLSFQDFLPRPVFMVPSTITTPVPCAPSLPGVNTASAPSSLCTFLPNGDPAAVSVPSSNSLQFNYPGTLPDPLNLSRTADLRFTLKASAAPYVDGLHLTNHVIESEQNSFGDTFDQTEVAELVLGEPELRIRKGVVAADDPSAVFSPPLPTSPAFKPPGTPGTVPAFTGTITSANVYPALNSNVSHVDGCDRLRFVIAVENIGSSPKGAFDVRIADLLPPCLKHPSNLRVVNGMGTLLPCVGGCSILNLFGPGLNLIDPIPNGALAPGIIGGVPNPFGTNIAIITFDATIPCGVVATGCCTNTAKLLNYAGVDGGPNHVSANFSMPFPDTTNPFSDGAQACIAPQLSKSIVATSEPSTPGNQVAIGEIVRYQMQVALPVGVSPGLTLTDNLPAGMAWLGSCTVSEPPPLIFPPPSVTPSGTNLTGIFGTVNNPGPNVVPVTVTCNALVLNSSANAAGAVKPNSFTVTLHPSSGPVSLTSNTVSVTIVEPAGALAKQEALPFPGAPPNLVFYQLSYTNTGTSTAFNVRIHDPLPAPLTVAGVTVTPATCTVVSPPPATLVEVSCPQVPPGGTVTVFFSARGLQPCVTVNNQATLIYDSLPGLHGTFPNPTGAFTPGLPGAPDGERIYTSGASVVTTHCPDLAISKMHSGNFICGPGQVGTYTITVTNVGNAPTVPPETVSDTLSLAFPFLSGGGSGWSCTPGSRTLAGVPVTCTSATSIPSGGSSTFTLIVGISCGESPVLPATIVNCATVSTTPELNLANNQSCDPTTVVADMCTQPPQGLTGWWPFDELTGPTAADISGSSPADNGTYVGAPTPSPGEVGFGLCFNGASDYVDVPTLPGIDFGNSDFLIDLWVKTTAGLGIQTLLDKRQSSTGLLKGYSLFLDNGLVGLQMADNSGASLTCGTSPGAACTNWVAPTGYVADGLWHLIAVTVVRRSFTAGGTFYVDGKAVGTFDPKVRSLSLNNAADLWIGASHSIAGGGVEYFPGCLDEVEIAQQVAGAEEIAAIYAAGAFGKCKP